MPNPIPMKTLSTLLLTLISFTSMAQIVVLGESPAAIEASYDFEPSGAWGADLDTTMVTGSVVLVDDGTVADSLGCQEFIPGLLFNALDIAGNIAAVYRGDCEFGEKALLAQNSGAIAVIIINNVPGGTEGMAAGAVGAQVTIPVVMISMEDGEMLRPYIDNGTLEMFIGNKTGMFVNDLGYYKQHASSAPNFATPHVMAQDSMDFKVLVSTWIHNYGNQTQTNVTLNATVDRDGLEIYNESFGLDSIPVGDSVFVQLPDHGSDNYQLGYYTITYSVSSAQTEDFPNDNELIFNWWINENRYSKSRIDPNSNQPFGNGGTRPTGSTEYRWCTVMESDNASATNVTGITFATTVGAGETTIGQGVHLEFIEWNDPVGSGTFDDLNLLADEFYDYVSDQANEFITVYFDQAVPLNDNQRYLSCVTVFEDSQFIVTDNGSDYTANAIYQEIFTPVNNIDDDSWFLGGFGPEYVPAIITETCAQAVASVNSATSCGSYDWNGNTYTQSGSYTYNTMTAEGCDSTALLNLNIDPAYDIDLDFDLCEGEEIVVGAETYTTGGNFVQNHSTAESCDSIVNIEVTMYGQPSMDILGNNNITPNSTETYAIIQAAGYNITWTVVGGTILSGQGTISISVFWDGTGTGSITVTFDNGICSFDYWEAMGQVTGIQNHWIDDMQIHPNPSAGIFNLELTVPTLITVMDSRGRKILETNGNGRFTLDLSAYPTGTYTLQLRTQTGVGVMRLVKY